MTTLEHPAIATAEQTCIACPDQWEGTLTDGRHFYFRLRSGIASLALGPTRTAVAGITRPDQPERGSGVAVTVMRHGDGLTGAFDSDDERSEVFRRLFCLVPQSPSNIAHVLGRDFPENVL